MFAQTLKNGKVCHCGQFIEVVTLCEHLEDVQKATYQSHLIPQLFLKKKLASETRLHLFY